MKNRKEQYVVGLDYSPGKQGRLKRLVGAWGYKSVRSFIVQAIDEKIEINLKQMTAEDRSALENIIENNQGENL